MEELATGAEDWRILPLGTTLEVARSSGRCHSWQNQENSWISTLLEIPQLEQLKKQIPPQTVQRDTFLADEAVTCKRSVCEATWGWASWRLGILTQFGWQTGQNWLKIQCLGYYLIILDLICPNMWCFWYWTIPIFHQNKGWFLNLFEIGVLFFA